jgi:hypothetical protein
MAKRKPEKKRAKNMPTVAEDNPSTTGDNGRDTKGKFAPGNKLAQGNPFARKVAQLRSALISAVSTEDVTAVIQKLVLLAKCGDIPAAKVLLDRVLGPSGADGESGSVTAIMQIRVATYDDWYGNADRLPSPGDGAPGENPAIPGPS